jgi:hypothetical protein
LLSKEKIFFIIHKYQEKYGGGEWFAFAKKVHYYMVLVLTDVPSFASIEVAAVGDGVFH